MRNKITTKIGYVVGIVLSYSCMQAAGGLTATRNDFVYKFFGMFKPEMFYGKNISLLNNNNKNDKIWFSRHTLDLKFDVEYGGQTYEDKVAEFFFTVRDRAIWGNPQSIAATTEAETKLLDAVGRKHKHAIPRHIFWMREAWLWFDLSTILGIDFGNHHSFTIGAFSFELGRGIALGDAFAVGPEVLGFYTEAAVDQYAFGGKFSGSILSDILFYDLYAAIINNKASSLSETGAKILGQEFGRIDNPARGFGKINFVIAGRLIWEIFNSERFGKMNIEPYALFNHDPEQRVEFLGDASSKLGTIGFAGEYYGDKVEFGFDYALNLGQQRVKGWDRNQVVEENRDGQVILVNNHVIDQNGKKVPFVSDSNAQNIINDAAQDEAFNNKVIGTVDKVGFVDGPVTLINTENRYRNPFTNKYEGWMFVADAAYWIYKHDIQIAVTAGITTGDDNPNEETKDGVFSGFISLQEIYSGKRVRSAFVLGGAGKLSRPLSVPRRIQSPSRFAPTVSQFTNLVFTGMALYWEPKDWSKEFSFNPNVYVYWLEKPINKFDFKTKQEIDQRASTYLGTEVNIFMHYYVLKNMKLFFVGSVFVPGKHFDDVRGKPLTSEQDKVLDRLDRTGFAADRVPNLGDDTAYTFNLGLEFKF